MKEIMNIYMYENITKLHRFYYSFQWEYGNPGVESYYDQKSHLLSHIEICVN